MPTAPVVAQLVERLRVGGAENLAVRLANGRAADGAPTHLYALQPGGALAARVAPAVALRDLDVRRASIRRPHAFLASVVAGRRTLCRCLDRDGVQILQAHLPEANFWSLLATGHGRPHVIATVHNNDEFHYGEDDGPLRRRLRRAAYRLILERCAAVVTVSARVRDSLVAELDLPSRLAGRLVVVPNGVTVPAPDPAGRDRVRAELGVPDDTVLLLGAGRLTEQKNFAALVDLAAALRADGRAVRTVIAGEGEQRPPLEARIADLGLDREVRLLGVRDDLDALFEAADLFVLSSRWEGLPLVLLEAMAAGCPVAGFAIDGTREVVEDGRHGLLAPLDDVATLAARIAGVLDDPGRLRAMGTAAREHVQAHHDFADVLARLEELYAEILARPRGRPRGPDPR
ncbi:glycosyltransferase [bacterium]|nr:glycosyltransferase [bacterium]